MWRLALGKAIRNVGCRRFANEALAVQPAVTQPVLCTSDDAPELLHWTLNCFSYIEPMSKELGVVEDDERDYFEYLIPKCCASGLTYKLVDEHGLFAGFRLTHLKERNQTDEPPAPRTWRWQLLADIFGDFEDQVWKLNPGAKKVVHHAAGLIVPTYQTRVDMTNFLTRFMDYKKLKAEGFDGEYCECTHFKSTRHCLLSGYKAIYKADMSKHRLPDGRPFPLTDERDTPTLVYRKL